LPIKDPERYPPNWPQIRAEILERAGHRCEGSPAFPDCRARNGWLRNNSTGEFCAPDDPISEAWELADGDSVTRIVLTIGHLDHTPENCAASNLRAWCQRCHLNYDAKLHATNSYMTRREKRAIGDLFK